MRIGRNRRKIKRKIKRIRRNRIKTKEGLRGERPRGLRLDYKNEY